MSIKIDTPANRHGRRWTHLILYWRIRAYTCQVDSANKHLRSSTQPFGELTLRTILILVLNVRQMIEYPIVAIAIDANASAGAEARSSKLEA